MNLLNIFRKIALLFGILFVIAVFIYLFALIIIHSSTDIKIVVTYISFLISAILFITVVYRFENFQSSKWIYACLAVLSFAYQIILSSNVPFNGEGDLQFNFSNAVSLASNHFTDLNSKFYCATFPGTITYPAVLSVFMKLFGINRMVPVLLNHMMICILVCAIYTFLKTRMSIIWALSGSLLFALHPFTIIYSNTYNAELIYGTFVMFSFFAFMKVNTSTKIRSQVTWIALVALFCGISILFRPLSIIMIIAFIIYIVFFTFDRYIKKLLFIAVLVSVFALCGFANNALVKTLTSYNPPSSSFGWNLYVGASATGRYNEDDAKEFGKVSIGSSSPTEIQKHFASEAIIRYKNIGSDIFIRGFRKLEPWLSYEYIANET
ncbi:MAG: glycosyltransferase family 39 protein, partial [Hyphomonadaceae bacterium]|nr:glycosyltransferase family 39 protein [Clostridia bacterium]